MSPRAVGVIISTLFQSEEDEKNIVEGFNNVLTELYTHPKDEINKFILKIKDKDIFSIRDSVFLRCVEDSVLAQKFTEAKINLKEDEPLSNLRKRCKADKCYEDLYILAMSLIEKKLHKDILKTVVSSPHVTNTGEPVFTAAESAIIAELHNIRDGVKEMRRENKELKEKLNLAITKIDKYEDLIEQQNTKISELTHYIQSDEEEQEGG